MLPHKDGSSLGRPVHNWVAGGAPAGLLRGRIFMAQKMSVERREELINNSRVREVFTPTTPIKSALFLYGRQEQVSRLVGQLSTPGGHALLYGDRGVGKTSVSNIVGNYFERKWGERGLFVHRSNPRDSFLDIMREPLKAAGVDLSIKETTLSQEQGGNAEVSIPFAKGGIESKQKGTETFLPPYHDSSPSWATSVVAKKQALFIIDELDVLENKSVAGDIAVFVKQLSDVSSSFKVLLVGIADTAQNLLAGHKSVPRALIEVKVPRLGDSELREIVTEGANRVSLRFADDVILKIVDISAGYPYFTHLVALKCAEEAVVAGKQRIDGNQLRETWGLAAKDAESSLRDRYDEAIEHDRDSLQARLLQAAAWEGETKFTSQVLARRFIELFGESPPKEELDKSMRELIYDTKILQLVKQNNVFRFVDPRMPSFIKLMTFAAGEKGIKQ